ncbi:MAG TPA: hypothetical protein VFW35_08385 [Sphingomicrobium sp.]|nr:hypothetical protein [Sphingomicrobium sp.]
MVLTITRAQCRDVAQRAAMIQKALAALEVDGVIWVDAPGRWRSAVAANFRAAGLEIGAPVAWRPRGSASVEFALADRGLRFALDRGHVSERWRTILAVLRYLPWGRPMLLRLLPGIGFSAFRDGTAPFGWLVDRLDSAHGADVALLTNWRAEEAPFLVFALGTNETLVAKRGGKGFEARISHEAAMLEQLRPGLANAGLHVPRVVDHHRTRHFSSLIESDVPGRPIAGLIREGHHRQLGAIIDRLADWLSRWNRATVRQVELTAALSEQLILSPAREVAQHEYLAWISGQTERLVGRKVPLVGAHNDLTMANVLGDRSAILSVVDWEAASTDGLPLADFYYAACDAAACLAGGDRLAAFQACFLEDGEIRQLVEKCEKPLRAMAAAPVEWLELCVHATWLRHAANEQARSSSRADGTFIGIVNALSASILGK